MADKYQHGSGRIHNESVSDHLKWLSALVFGGLFLVVTILIVAFELDPQVDKASPYLPFYDNGRFGYRTVLRYMTTFCIFGVAGVLTWGFLRRWSWANHPKFRLFVKAVLIVAVLISGLSYFYARRGITRDNFSHTYDTYHYFLNARYYSNIGYEDLYACTLEALTDTQIPDDARVRDLRTYQMTTAGELRAQNLCTPSEKFTAQEWERWQKDVNVFATSPDGLEILQLAITDRGYNGTPLHSTLSGALASKLPFSVATHNLLPIFDVAILCFMLGAVVVAFGWQVGLIFAFSVFTLAADRWGTIGGSWFRYSWLVTLVLGLTSLRRGQYGWSGFWMATSAMLNVFPLVFSLGVLIRGVVTSIQEGKLLPRYRNFVLAGILTGVVGLGIGALPAQHVANYTGWIENMQKHNSERFQGYGVGMKFSFVYRGANTKDADRVRESVRRNLFHENRKAYYPLAGLALALALAIAVRTQNDIEAATILGFTIFFCFLGTVGYYFACANVLLLGLYRRYSDPGGIIFLALWFTVSAISLWAFFETQYPRFMYNTVLSMSWTIWLMALLFWIAAREGILQWFARLIAAPSKPEV